MSVIRRQSMGEWDETLRKTEYFVKRYK